LKTNYSDLSYSFPVGEAIAKGDVVSLVAGKLRKGFGVGVGVTDVFASGVTNVKVAYLTATTFIASYQSSDKGMAVIGTIDASRKISIGTPSQYHSAVQSGEFDVAEVTNSKFAVVYRDKGKNDCYAKVGTVSGTTITWGTTANKFSASCNIPVVSSLGNEKIGMIFKDPAQSGAGMGIIGRVADANNINFGSVESFHAFNVDKLSISMLTNDMAIFGFIDTSKNSRVMSQIYRAQGMDVSFNSKKEISTDKTTHMSVSNVGDGKAAIAFRTANNDAKVVIVDIVNGYIEPGNALKFDSGEGPSPQISLAGLGKDRLLIIFRDAAGHGKLIDGDVVGKMVLLGRIQTFSASPSSSAGVAAIGSQWIVAFQDNADSNKGKVQVISQWGGARALGIAKEAGSSGTVEVVLQGVVDAFSAGSFSSGGVYYAKNDGKLSASTGVSLGRALTDSLLLLENLAQQNEESQGGGSVSVSGFRRLLRARQTTTSGQDRGGWTNWNDITFQTPSAFTISNRRFQVNQPGIFYVSAYFAVVGGGNRVNWMYLYHDGTLQLRTTESCWQNWWHTLRIDSIVQLKKDSYVQTSHRWSSSTQGHNNGYSGFHMIEVQNSYEPN